ncbi:MAG: hypothetical protein EP330_21230 [Deltaproteobacteria bacterium]|nr:MAG: hypothetical protein EP330_21230 [Deltaproteobacteria bacterium]
MEWVAIAERLGAGAQGEVYAGTLEDGRRVAVKRLAREPGREEIQRLHFEAALLARTGHSGILQPVGLAWTEGEVVLLTELAEGADLARLAAALRPPPAVVMALGAAIAEILDEAVRAPGPDGRPLGLVHRDLHAGNVVVGADGRPRVLDLGVGHTSLSRGRRTASGQQLGQLDTLAPEALLDADAAPPRDVFALAAMLLQLLRGTPIYGGRTARQVATLAASEARFDELIGEAMAGVPGAEVLRASLAHDPRARPTAAELAEVLARASLAGGGSAQGWARQALDLLPPLAPGPWSNRRLTLEPAGFDRDTDVVDAGDLGAVGEADPTVRDRRGQDTARIARRLPTRGEQQATLEGGWQTWAMVGAFAVAAVGALGCGVLTGLAMLSAGLG